MDGWGAVGLIILGIMLAIVAVAVLVVVSLVKLWKKQKQPGANKKKLRLEFAFLLMVFLAGYTALAWKGPLAGNIDMAQAYKRASKQHSVYLFKVPKYKRGRPIEAGGSFTQRYELDDAFPLDSYNSLLIEEEAKIHEEKDVFAECQKLVAATTKISCEHSVVAGHDITTRVDGELILTTFVMNDTFIQVQALKTWEYPEKAYKLDAEMTKTLIDSAYIHKLTTVERVLAL